METKFKNLVALANETQTVKVKFTETGSEYTYKVPRGLAVQVSDRVVVEARDKLTVANVASIDSDTDIDIDADINYKWVIALVNAEAYDSAIAKEEELVTQLKQRRKIAAARQALDALGMTQEELLKLK